jgi:hypothetical protein
MITRLVAFPIAKPKYDTEAILETYELLIYGNLHYITNSFCKNVLKIATH